jgi:hypothetical protein
MMNENINNLSRVRKQNLLNLLPTEMAEKCSPTFFVTI